VAAISLYWARPHLATEDELHTLESLGEVAVMLYLQLRRVEELQARLNGQEQRLALAAQQLRAPLTPIRLALKLLQLRVGGPRVVAYGRDIIQRQVRHLARLIGDLSEPVAAEELSLRPVRMDLTQALRDLADDLRPGMEDMQRSLRLELPSHPVWLQADAMRLNQAFMHLLHGAVRATPAGGDVRLSMSCSHVPRMATVVVEDGGTNPGGLGQEASLSVYGTDLGWLQTPQLGLKLSRLIVERHRGTLTQGSAGPQRGMRVTVRLPAEQPEEPLPGLGQT
jgi:signal transduction histidine kinase